MVRRVAVVVIAVEEAKLDAGDKVDALRRSGANNRADTIGSMLSGGHQPADFGHDPALPIDAAPVSVGKITLRFLRQGIEESACDG